MSALSHMCVFPSGDSTGIVDKPGISGDEADRPSVPLVRTRL